MRVWKGGGHQELELLTPLDLFVSKSEIPLFDLLKENWLKSWVKILSNIFNEYPLSILNSDFKVSKEGRITHLVHIESVIGIVLTK